MNSFGFISIFFAGRGDWGLCEYVVVNTILPTSPVIFLDRTGWQTKMATIEFGYHDVMCTGPLGLVRLHHSSHQIATQPSHFVDRAGWQATMASIEFGYLDVLRTGPIAGCFLRSSDENTAQTKSTFHKACDSKEMVLLVLLDMNIVAIYAWLPYHSRLLVPRHTATLSTQNRSKILRCNYLEYGSLRFYS